MRFCRSHCGPCGEDNVYSPTPLLGHPETWSDWSSHPALLYYTPLSVLGSGAFSKVFHGRCHESGEEVAMKVVYRRKPSVSAWQWSILRNEVLMLERIDHPNVVKIKDHFEDAKQLVIVMEMIRGGEILAHMKVIKKYSEKAAALLFRQKLQALASLHSKGIIHRDIKPENIILQKQDKGANDDALLSGEHGSSRLAIKIIDLGMAHELGGSTSEPRGVVGTIGFVAPEVCLMLPHSPSMDIWSLGVMLYIMLCGSLPYTNTQLEKMTYVNIPFRLSEGYHADEFKSLSFSARDMIVRMLTHSPENRATAQELLQHAWIVQDNPQDTPLPSVSTGARKVASYRSSRGMANCVVVDSSRNADEATSQYFSDHTFETESKRSILVSMDTERKFVHTHELVFDPEQFMHNFHDDRSNSRPKNLRKSEGIERPRRTRVETLGGEMGRWSDTLLTAFPSIMIENMLTKRRDKTQKSKLHVVSEEQKQPDVKSMALHATSEFSIRRSIGEKDPVLQLLLRRASSVTK